MKALEKLRSRMTAPSKPAAPVSGLAAGTIILTLEGELPIEFLSAGDRIITRDSGMTVVRGLRRREVTCDAVLVTAGSLGHDRPVGDTILPAGQKILVRDWRAQALYGTKQAMIPAARLVDGEFVRAIGKTTMIVYEIICDRDHVIYAGGLELAAERIAEPAKI